ncbi:MAG TPA: DUF4097 family beta strand repeat-containing protein [Bryobacteraceae bacterium]
MRRRSISGPVIVIALGLLFFINNFYPDIFSWRSLLRFWPFLLIGLGVIRLVEVLIDAGHARPLQPSSFNFPGFAVLVIGCFFLWGLSHSNHVAGARSSWHGFPAFHVDPTSMFGEEFDFDLNESMKMTMPVNSSDARVVLEGLRGNVTVTGDDSSEVAVSGHKSVHAFNQRSADDANRRTRIEIVRNGNDVVVRSAGTPDRDDITITYDVDVRVPRRLGLMAQGSPENVTAESLDGNVEISGDRGNVHLTSIAGNVRVETTRRKDLVRAVGIKGTLELRGTGTDLQLEDIIGQVNIQGNYYGTLNFRNLAKPLHFESEQTELRVEKLPGSISMDLGDFRAEDVTGPLRLRCQSRDVHIANFSNDVEINVERGDVELDPRKTPLGKVTVRLRAGDIDLSIPQKGAFELHASTSQGDVDNQYGAGIDSNSEGRSATMKSTGPGGPAIMLTTERGNITVKKS